MKSLSRLPEADLEGSFEVRSVAVDGVRLRIWNVTLAKRIELTSAIREITVEQEYHAADLSERGKVSTALASLKAEEAVLRWGLAGVAGLVVDGTAVTVEDFVERAPEALAREALLEIQKASSLTASERKN